MHASFHGTFSHITDPDKSNAGKPIHVKTANWIAAGQPVIPRRLTKYARTQARTTFRAISPIIFTGCGFFMSATAAELSSARCLAKAMYHAVLKHKRRHCRHYNRRIFDLMHSLHFLWA